MNGWVSEDELCWRYHVQQVVTPPKIQWNHPKTDWANNFDYWCPNTFGVNLHILLLSLRLLPGRKKGECHRPLTAKQRNPPLFQTKNLSFSNLAKVEIRHLVNIRTSWQLSQACNRNLCSLWVNEATKAFTSQQKMSSLDHGGPDDFQQQPKAIPTLNIPPLSQKHIWKMNVILNFTVWTQHRKTQLQKQTL